jgi:hypothetical protein
MSENMEELPSDIRKLINEREKLVEKARVFGLEPRVDYNEVDFRTLSQDILRLRADIEPHEKAQRVSENERLKDEGRRMKALELAVQLVCSGNVAPNMSVTETAARLEAYIRTGETTDRTTPYE